MEANPVLTDLLVQLDKICNPPKEPVARYLAFLSVPMKYLELVVFLGLVHSLLLKQSRVIEQNRS